MELFPSANRQKKVYFDIWSYLNKKIINTFIAKLQSRKFHHVGLIIPLNKTKFVIFAFITSDRMIQHNQNQLFEPAHPFVLRDSFLRSIGADGK